MEINKHKDLDQIFREQLHDYEVAPPASVWAGVQAEALNTSAGKASQWRWWAAAALLGLLMTTAGYFYFGEDEADLTPQNIENVQLEESPQILPESPIENSGLETEAAVVENEIKEAQIIASMEEESPIEERIDIVIEESVQENIIIEEKKILETDTEVLVDKEQETLAEEMKSITQENIDLKAENSSELDNPVKSESPSKAGYDFFDDDVIDEITKGHLYDKYWKLGIEFSPEWITIPDNDNNIQSYGLDLSAKYHFSNWFVESGLGVAFSKDDGVYNVDYQEALFKGSYQDVYDVTFDTSSGIPVPTYYTKLVDVYDTIDHVIITENKNSYVYLNIPLNIGYTKALSEKFTFYAKTGLIASFKVYENIPTPTVTGTNTTIVAITPLYHQRTSWHLQAQLNVGIDYYITEKFLFGVEPNARYFVKSLVDPNTKGNPYGFGVKLGFKYIIK